MARGFVLIGAGIILAAALCIPAAAHDGSVSVDLDDMLGTVVTHDDQSPFKGWFSVTAKNMGNVPWGDFHFEIMPCEGSDISNVLIMDDAGYEPTTDRDPFTYDIDNVAVGSTLDYYFYSDPVNTGDTATFTFYTDNTADMVNFCVSMCPTPVPEPAMLTLLGVGLASLVLTRRRK